MSKNWYYSYVVSNNNTGAMMLSIETMCKSKEDAIDMLESAYAKDAFEYETVEGFFSEERAWRSTENYHMEYDVFSK